MKSLFIEGVCGCGKTTTVNKLGSMLPAFVVPELTEFVRGLLSPFSTEEFCAHNFDNYVRFEQSRESIVSAIPDDIPFTVFDRSYISIIALSLSMIDLLPIEYPSRIVCTITSLIAANRLVVPDAVIVLSANYDAVSGRNAKKEKNLDSIWTDRTRLDMQMSFYNELAALGSASIISSMDSICGTALSCARELKVSHSLDKSLFIQSIEEAVKRVVS